MRLTPDAFAELVDQAVVQVPQAFRKHLEGVTIDVEPRPSRADLASVDLDDPHDLLGLYHGTPLDEQSVQSPVDWPNRIVLYQHNIERICRTRTEIIEQIRITLLHEIGHHFGMEEDDLDELGYG